MQIRPLTATAAACVLAAPLQAFAVDYLSAEQAATSMFPEADRFAPQQWLIDSALQQALAAQGLRARSPQVQASVAWHGDAALGFVVVDEVIGKFELIRYAVAVGLDGAVKQVEILSYRESHGAEVRLPAWRRQFIGKRATSPLHVGDDIANISGATLSCTHVTDGVKRVVLVLDAARRSGTLAP